jgi:hypothetical protein
MANKTIAVNYAPQFRAVPSFGSSWASFSEQVHRLH